MRAQIEVDRLTDKVVVYENDQEVSARALALCPRHGLVRQTSTNSLCASMEDDHLLPEHYDVERTWFLLDEICRGIDPAWWKEQDQKQDLLNIESLLD